VGALVQFLRRWPRDVSNGIHAFVDLLLWGQVYPRRLDLRDIWRP
jgi:hypothetical protein